MKGGTGYRPIEIDGDSICVVYKEKRVKHYSYRRT